MTDTTPVTPEGKRNIWVRGLLMLLMAGVVWVTVFS